MTALGRVQRFIYSTTIGGRTRVAGLLEGVCVFFLVLMPSKSMCMEALGLAHVCEKVPASIPYEVPQGH